MNSFDSRNRTDISNREPQFVMFSMQTLQFRKAHLEKLLQFSWRIFQFIAYTQSYKMFYCSTNHLTSQSTSCKLLSSKGQWDSHPLRPSILYIVTMTTKTEEFWPFSLTALVTKKLPVDKFQKWRMTLADMRYYPSGPDWCLHISHGQTKPYCHSVCSCMTMTALKIYENLPVL